VTTPTEPRPDMDALLGAYVLDALDADERALVEAYLEENPRARAEVDDLRETTAILAGAPVTDTAPSPELWERIVAEVDAEPDTPDELSERRRDRGARRAVWVTSGVAAVAAAVALVLGVQVASLNNDLDEEQDPSSRNMAAEFSRATEMDGAQEAALVADREVARVVVLPDGTGYLVNDDLEPLRPDQTYQLWAFMGDETDRRVISAGVLGADPTAASFKVEGPVAGFALTVEAAGGVPTSAQAPYAVANLA